MDVSGGYEGMSQGATDMDVPLANLEPSYNIDQQPISDAVTLVKPAKLRGLPPDASPWCWSTANAVTGRLLSPSWVTAWQTAHRILTCPSSLLFH